MVALVTEAASTPRPEVALDCGSQSTTRTRRPISAKAVPRLMVVVVLPTPPFWLATAMIRLGTGPDYLRERQATGAAGVASRRRLSLVPSRRTPVQRFELSIGFPRRLGKAPTRIGPIGGSCCG